MLLTDKLDLNEVEFSCVLHNDSALGCSFKLEADISSTASIKGGELDGSINLAKCHHILK